MQLPLYSSIKIQDNEVIEFNTLYYCRTSNKVYALVPRGLGLKPSFEFYELNKNVIKASIDNGESWHRITLPDNSLIEEGKGFKKPKEIKTIKEFDKSIISATKEAYDALKHLGFPSTSQFLNFEEDYIVIDYGKIGFEPEENLSKLLGLGYNEVMFESGRFFIEKK